MRATASFLLLMASACAATPPKPVLVTGEHRPDSGTLLVRCGRLLDGISDVAREGVEILIENGTVTELGSELAIPPSTPVLDLTEFTVLPGLIDMHTHLTDRAGDTADLSVYFERTEEEQAQISRENSRVTLAAGFTSVRNVGAYIAWTGRTLRDDIDAGRFPGPRMQVAGYYLTIPGGGGDLLIPGFEESEIPARVRMGVARGADAFREKARLAVEGGADFLKVIASGAVLAYGGVPGEPEMTPEEIHAVAEVAHGAGKRLAAHAHGARSIQEAILAGADTIEHASLLDEESIRLASEHGVALSMDIYCGDYIDAEGRRQGWPEEFLVNNLETTEAQRQGFTKAHGAGVAIVFGTDSAVYPHGDNAKQFRVMVERGMRPLEAIRAATSEAARFMGWGDRVGALREGLLGDLIAVRGDPLADVTVLENVDVVVKGGLVFKAPADSVAP